MPPEGVEAQFAFGGGAGGNCISADEDGFGPAPSNQYDTGVLWEGTDYCLLFSGFESNAHVRLRLIAPDGSISELALVADDSGTVFCGFAVLPGEPLGTYSVISSVDGTQLSVDRFDVIRPDVPGIVIRLDPHPTPLFVVDRYEDRPVQGPAGSTVRVYLTGWRPNERVDVHVYYWYAFGQCTEGSVFSDYYVRIPCEYVTSFLDLEVNEFGSAIYELVTGVDDPQGTYFLKDLEGSISGEPGARVHRVNGSTFLFSDIGTFILTATPPSVSSRLPSADLISEVAEIEYDGPPYELIPMVRRDDVIESWMRVIVDYSETGVESSFYSFVCARYGSGQQAVAATDEDARLYVDDRNTTDQEQHEVGPIGDARLGLNAVEYGGSNTSLLWFTTEEVGCRFSVQGDNAFELFDGVVALARQVTDPSS